MSSSVKFILSWIYPPTVFCLTFIILFCLETADQDAPDAATLFNKFILPIVLDQAPDLAL